MRRQYTSQQRSDVVDLVTSGRATIREAASQVGVAPATAYYWMRRGGRGERPAGRARRASPRPALQGGMAGPTFVRLVSSREVPSEIRIQVGGAEIQVRREFDRDLLRAVVEALGGGAA